MKHLLLGKVVVLKGSEPSMESCQIITPQHGPEGHPCAFSPSCHLLHRPILRPCPCVILDCRQAAVPSSSAYSAPSIRQVVPSPFYNPEMHLGTPPQQFSPKMIPGKWSGGSSHKSMTLRSNWTAIPKWLNHSDPRSSHEHPSIYLWPKDAARKPSLSRWVPWNPRKSPM